MTEAIKTAEMPELPELPQSCYVLGCESDGYNGDRLYPNEAAFTADQIREYGRQCAALAERAPETSSAMEPTDEQLREVWMKPGMAVSPVKFARAVLALAAPAVPEPVGWLYDWTHSSALGKPDEDFTSFTTDEAYARKHRNARAVYTNAVPAAQSAVQAEPAADVREKLNQIRDAAWAAGQAGNFATVANRLINDFLAKSIDRSKQA